MIPVRMFPRAFAVCLLTGLFSSAAVAQDEGRPRPAAGPAQATTTATAVDGRLRLENEIAVPAGEYEESTSEEERAAAPPAVRRLMLDAIEERLGTPYRLGSEGPDRFDCSGFVWSVFREAGFSFERGSARTFWSRFEPVDGLERYEFGTLVFFNNLNHVGIVADENGFYHASTSRGVVYSTFNEYWAKRISGFRRVPADLTLIASAGR